MTRNQSRSARPAIVALALGFLPVAGTAAAADKAEVQPTNVLERMHVKNEKCHWTDEMGKYMYDCLKANFNMNAHWCHNEAMEVFCPAQQGAATGVEPGKAAN
jgi:hypothetical protein